MLISELPESERPREKLLQNGAASLSDAELLALFLRTGMKGLSAIDLARRWLKDADGLRGLLGLKFADAKRLKGLGLARFAELQGALELGRRVLTAELVRNPKLNGPDSIAELVQRELRPHTHEVFACVFMDSQHRLLAFETLALGGLTEVHITPRRIVEAALKHRASGVVLAHNHPSGVREPSSSDELITRRTKQALALIDVKLIDHIIIADGPPVSMALLGLV